MKAFFSRIFDFLKSNTAIVICVAGVLVVATVVTTVLIGLPDDNAVQVSSSDKSSIDASAQIPSINESSSGEDSSDEPSSSSSGSSSSTPSSSSSKPQSSLEYKPNFTKVLPYDSYESDWTPPFENGYAYNKKLDINNNVFRDSLIYTGYNIKRHNELGKMWVYIYSKDKRPLGILSDISYDYDGGSSGYETDEFGRPHIRFYEENNMVCASFATYVYFNYLPNVAKIDTSNLTRPVNPTLAQDWQVAALDWVNKGYSRTIDFKVSGSAGRVMSSFKPAEDIPIGSIISFYDMKKTNKNWSNHVVIYAGYKNNQHWVYQVGNDCGPEFCTVERMTCNPYPMWPINIVTTPNTVLKYFE